MIKVFKILVTFCVTSMFLFPFIFNPLPVMNTKTFMAAVGVVFCAWYFVKRRELSVMKNLIPLFVLSGIVSLIAMFSMTYNRTIDDAYSGYIISMAVWLSAAFVVCNCIKYTHEKIDIELLCNYVIAVCVFQCVTAIMIDSIPSFQRIVDTYIYVDQRTLHEINRLYGIGANLDVAGTRFSACLLMITALLVKQQSTIPGWKLILYFTSYCIILVIGSMIARTTYVGVILSAMYVVFSISITSAVIPQRTLRMAAYVLGVTFVIVFFFVYEYNHNPDMRYWIRFAFEGFFNLFERGEYSVASTDTLKSMYVFPDNLKTWIIGDGYFSNPYWSDPNFLWQGQNMRGFYKDTDVGYLRFIFYFGIIGLVSFIIYFFKVCATCIARNKEYKRLFIYVLIANFVIWLKVATDLFIIFALFICTLNMMPDEDEEIDQEEDDEGEDESLLTESVL